MKYSICDFSQAEITRFNDSNPGNELDPTDLLIFQWFIDFAAASNIPSKNGTRKGMWKKIIDETEYYYIKYSALIDEFPILGYQSIRQIQRRFDKYVSTGLLCKKVFHEGRKGSFSYFGFTEKLFSLKYDATKTSQKVNPHKDDSEEMTENYKEPATENIEVNIESVTDDKNVMSKAVTDDENVMSKAVTDDENVMSKAVTDDKNVMCFKRNSTTNLNPSTTSENSPCINENESFSGAEEELYSKTKELFGYEVIFQPNPYPLLIQRLRSCGVSRDKWSSYISWAFQYLSERVKNKDSFDGYFYRSITYSALIQKYNRYLEENLTVAGENVASGIKCPVCGATHGRFEDCPVCGLSETDRTNEDVLKTKRQVWSLPESERACYNARLTEINERYFRLGITAITNPEIRRNQKTEISQLNAEYHIA